jgi:hypothetical protein
MNNASSLRIRLLSACMMTAAMGFAAPAAASPPTPLPPPDPLQIWGEGVACDFPLSLQSSGAKYHIKDFVDKDGNVRLIVAGKGSLMTLTNMDSGATITLKAYGFSDEITFATEGTQMDTIRGHVLIINTPREALAEPFTTYYVGRLVLTTDTSTGFSTIQSFDGKSTDICTALE